MPRDPTQGHPSFANADTLPAIELGAGAPAGDWVIEAVHARGGFGAVYRARHVRDGRPAAVKVLHRYLHPSRAARERFAREIDVVRRVAHPNVVPLYDVGTLEDGRPFFAMEWIDGPSLDAKIAAGPVALADAVAILEGVCAGVAAAHAAGVLHRDLKAANVLLAPGTPPQSVRLVDFGIARLLDDDDATQLTASGARVGTPASMAPEQITGAPLTPATDVYALGILLYHVLTGRLPFEAENAVEVQAMHLGDTPPLASLVAPVPGAVDDVVTRCLDKSPARRFAGPAELATALRRAAEDPTPARRVQSGRQRAAAVHLTGGSAESLAEARRALVAAGFQLVREWPDALLAAVILGDDTDEARARRVAGELARATTSAGRHVRLHIDEARTLTVAGAARVVGGAILSIDAWPASSRIA